MRQGRISVKTGAANPGLGALLAVLLFLGPGRGAAAADPDPQELLKVARIASTQQEAFLRGQLRSGPQAAPFTLQVDFGKLRFAFVNPERVYEVRLEEESSGVYDAKGRSLRRGMQEPVADGAPVTVEDLSLGFLYWPDARLLGEENVRGRGAWKIELRPGRRGSEFAVVRVWLDRASGALLRIEGFDWEGKLLRRFEVVSGQRIDGRWMLKQMRIEKFAPDNATRPVGRSYLEILGKEGA
ncbi:MAG: outer membrane lipoprotein-sorting protein [Chthoniobacterales bacterium]